MNKNKNINKTYYSSIDKDSYKSKRKIRLPFENTCKYNAHKSNVYSKARKNKNKEKA